MKGPQPCAQRQQTQNEADAAGRRQSQVQCEPGKGQERQERERAEEPERGLLFDTCRQRWRQAVVQADQGLAQRLGAEHGVPELS